MQVLDDEEPGTEPAFGSYPRRDGLAQAVLRVIERRLIPLLHEALARGSQHGQDLRQEHGEPGVEVPQPSVEAIARGGEIGVGIDAGHLAQHLSEHGVGGRAGVRQGHTFDLVCDAEALAELVCQSRFSDSRFTHQAHGLALLLGRPVPAFAQRQELGLPSPEW